MNDLINKNYWKVQNKIKEINDIMKVIKIFIDKGTIISIEQLNTTIENTLKDKLKELNEIIGG